MRSYLQRISARANEMPESVPMKPYIRIWPLRNHDKISDPFAEEPAPISQDEPGMDSKPAFLVKPVGEHPLYKPAAPGRHLNSQGPLPDSQYLDDRMRDIRRKKPESDTSSDSQGPLPDSLDLDDMNRGTQRHRPESVTPSDKAGEAGTPYILQSQEKDFKEKDESPDFLPPDFIKKEFFEQIPKIRIGKPLRQDSSIFFQEIEKNNNSVLRNNGKNEKPGYDTEDSSPKPDEVSKAEINTKHHRLSENEQERSGEILKKYKSLIEPLNHSAKKSEPLTQRLQPSAPKQPHAFSVSKKDQKGPRLVIGRLKVEVVPPAPKAEKQKIIRSTIPQQKSIPDLKRISSVNKLRFGLGQM